MSASASAAAAQGGFDPSAFERAATAMREISESPHAAQAFEVQRERERTAQAEAQTKSAEATAQGKAFEVERVQAEHQQRRQTIQADQQAKQQQAYYNDQLARKRHEDGLRQQAAMRDQEMRRQEESQLKVEGLRRQTAEYEASLRKQTDEAKVAAEVAGRIRQERENRDLYIERLKIEAGENRTTVMQAVREAGRLAGDGIQDFLTDYQKLGTAVGVATFLAVGIYTAKVSTGVAGRFVEARLGKPPLVRETSRRTALQALTQPLATAKRAFGSLPDAMSGMVLEPVLHGRMSNLARTTANTKANGAPYRHMLLYGPPGTGKTMFAKNLAQASGMDYAILTGGDVAPLGRDGVTEMHKLFDWAGTSNKGLLLFVDEADAFLRKRSGETISEDLRNALNVFLYRTGEASRSFQIVFASNQPEQLDWAVMDRTDEAVEFALPGEAERASMMKQYFGEFITGPPVKTGMFSSGRQITVSGEGVEDALFDDMAARTEGFSGREINKLAIAWQAAAYGTEACSISAAMMEEVLEIRIEQNMKKGLWSDKGGV